MIASGNMHYLYLLKLTHIEATPLKNVGPRHGQRSPIS